MDPEFPHHLRNQPRVLYSCWRLLIGISDAQPSAHVQVVQIDSGSAELADITRKAPDRAAKRLERSNLRTNVSANPPPPDPIRITMQEIQPLRFGPIQSKLMFDAQWQCAGGHRLERPDSRESLPPAGRRHFRRGAKTPPRAHRAPPRIRR